MFYESEAFASVVPFNNKPGAKTSKHCEVPIMRTDYHWRRHGAPLYQRSSPLKAIVCGAGTSLQKEGLFPASVSSTLDAAK
jgi:hypothetical protein